MTTRNANLDKNLGSRNQYRADTRALGQISYRLTGAFQATQKYLAGRMWPPGRGLPTPVPSSDAVEGGQPPC